MPGPFSQDQFVIIIDEAADGFVTQYLLYKNRSPVREVNSARGLLAAAINSTDSEDYRISVDKTALKTEIGLAIDNFLAV